jgi:hypothetical protein
LQEPAPAARSAGEQTPSPPVPLAANPDYYARRAREAVEEDAKLTRVKPHPLAAAHPGFNVVVCDAGCPKGLGAEIVFLERIGARDAARRSVMVPTSSDARPATTAAGAQSIECIGGCYDTPKSYPARVAETSTGPASLAVIGGWVTTVTRADGTSEAVTPGR